MMIFEVLGTIASIMVLISFLMKSEERIRAINIIGALIFVVYGIGIDAFSVWFLNGSLCLVHVCRLHKLKKKGEHHEQNKETD